MEFLTLVAALFVAISFMFAPCASSDQANLQNIIDPKVYNAKFSTNLPSLPRKLKLNEEEKSYADKDLMPHKKFLDPSSGTKQQEYEETEIVANEKGTSNSNSRERVEAEGSNKTEYFTMDYNWIRRRRPIHNKHVPFVP